ncbi:hypothetical protein [Phycicoccus sp. Soil803]|uniref:hypothetical protein n=1 Tax=Phycicoccus sp. Soil803 TaxID=1736415 RepID=UPI000B1098D9|nr:hypothetical protein [Phycicoccus sp. Soil803]
MPVDDRLRVGLTANAAALREPDVELLLGQAFAAHRRRQARRWAGVAGVAAAACAALVVTLMGQTAPKPVPAPPVGPTPATLHDRYAGLVAPFAEAPHVSGRWVLVRGADGKLVANPPNRYGTGDPVVAGRIGRGGVFGTDMFHQDNLICDSPGGKYRIADRGDQLVFESVDDFCVSRVQFFTKTTWISTSVTAYTGPRIPDGRWARDVTVGQLNDVRFWPDAAWKTSNGFSDGTGRIVIEFAGSRWFILFENDQGGLEIRDQGTVRYDALGRWVQNGSTAVEWSIRGETLTTRNAVPVEGLHPLPARDADRGVLEGSWRRVR